MRNSQVKKSVPFLFSKVETRTANINVVPSFDVSSIWVGSAEIYSHYIKGNTPTPIFKLRRIARVRDGRGLCKYFLWTEPDKGKMMRVCIRFKKRVEIAPHKFLKHFGFPHTVEVQQVDKKEKTREIIEKYLASLKKQNIDIKL